MTDFSQLQAVIDNIDAQSLTASVNYFAEAIQSLDTSSISDPVIADTINMIFGLFLELSKLTN